MEDVEHVVSAMDGHGYFAITPLPTFGWSMPPPSHTCMVVYGASPMALPYWSHNG
jgi:hypothetical protein